MHTLVDDPRARTRAARDLLRSARVRKAVRRTAIAVLGLVVAFNAVAFAHAYRMTHFVAEGTRTARPEQLSLGARLLVLLTGVTVPRPENRRGPDAFGLPYETHTFASSDGVELEAWYVPHRAPRGVIAMFPGYASAKESLLLEARAFHDLGFAMLLVDFRGSGGSAGSTTSVGYYEAGDVAAAAVEARELCRDVPLVLYGKSMGAAAVLRAVGLELARPDDVVVECPFDSLLTTVYHRFDAVGLPAFAAAEALVFWGGLQQGFDGFAHNPGEYAKHVRCPTLLMHGARDPRVTVDEARAIFDNLAGPKRFELFEDREHESYYAAEPERWTRTVTALLSSD